MRSPFKFLDSFRQEDVREFFGRDEETRLLYDFVNKNRLIIVYGTSGTGKTSLVQCGLSSRFDSTDWLPLFIRRGYTINESLREELFNYESSTDKSIPDIIGRINSKYLRPVYLIFDQLEELLILGDEQEQTEFITTIKQLLQDPDLDCHVLFILREEFLARLYPFEKEIPSLFDRRLRVEPMSRGKLQEVILRSTKQFNISLEDPDKNTEQIIARLSAGKSGISLPYLQVYLDMLWREDYERTYPDVDESALETALAKKQYPKLEFTTAEIEGFGQIEDVLARFLTQQTMRIQEQLNPECGDNPDLVKLVLDCFVTEEGTKYPIPYTVEQEVIYLGVHTPEFLRSLPEIFVTKVLRQLEQSRILRFTEDTIELAHDALAALIDQQRSDTQRRVNDIYNRLKNNYREYQESNEYLNRKQLTVLEEYLPQLTSRLDERLLDFIAASYREAEAKEQAELNQAKAQEAKEKQLREYAETALARLEQSLAVIQERNVVTFREFAELGTRLVYTLDHVDALQKLGTAAGIEVAENIRCEALTPPLSELLFFFTEGGRRFELAREAAVLLLRLGQSALLSELLHRCIQEQWSSRVQFEPLLAALPDYIVFKSRYYPTMRDVPMGKDGIFEMGSYPGEWGHRSDETLHKVQLKPYQMAETPVTFYQFALFSESVGLRMSSRTPYWGRYGNHPMVNVTWYEATEYANWLNGQLGIQSCYDIYKKNGSDPNNEAKYDFLKWKVWWKSSAWGYRLPTEAEWELAARGGVGTTRYLFSGGNTLDELGWYSENSGDIPLSGDWDENLIYDNNARTHPVGEKKNYGIGLYDMSGNVFEWCWDWYDDKYYKNCPLVNPLGADAGSSRILRGGSWYYDAHYSRVAKRFNHTPDNRSSSIGFRLARRGRFNF